MAEGGSCEPDLESQRNEISTLMKKPLIKGDTWYLIDHKWFKQWKKYVGYDTLVDVTSIGEQSSHPGPIDNGPLFKDESCTEIKEHLIDELDYVLVPHEVWDLIASWYLTTEGQLPIARKVVEYGMFVKHCKVEVYLMDFKLCQNNDLDNCITRNFSKADTIEFIQQEMRKLYNIPDDKETRLWNRYTSTAYEHLSKKDSTVQDVGLHAGQFLVLEQQNADGSWPRQPKKSTRYGSASGGSYGGNYSSYNYGEGGMGNVQPGLCGLCNVGNTCFMNSALQCMSNCPPLMRYFNEERYFSELNTENPLGMRGEIAKAFGDLIKIMWSGMYQYTSPRNFKMQVGRFAPQFSGYQQQDSQELMAFLLDGLHEDLNRIKRKPYIELKDADGRPDAEVAREAWENYRKRNDSIIVDIFHGLLKSTLVCPECSNVSVTFDPFCYLSLPLPMKKERQIEVFFISLDPFKKPVQYKLTVPKMGNVSDLCTALSRFTGIPPVQMMVTDVYNHKFHKVFQQEDGLNTIFDKDDIFVYEVPAVSDDADTLVVPVYMREKKVRSGYNNYSSSSLHLFGQPILVPLSKQQCTYDQLYDLILAKMQRYVQVPEPEDKWWVEPDEINGEVEMTNGDEDYDNRESPVADQNGVDGNSSGSGEQNGVTIEDAAKTTIPKTPKLFTIHIVNSYGNTDVDTIEDGDKHLKLSNKSYIAINWHPRAKEKFFDEKQAEVMEQHNSIHSRSTQKKQVIQLNECLELFTATEKLSAEDSWYCPKCKEHQQATKKFDLWSLPQVLVLYFKRFSYTRYWRDKIDTLVEFPYNGLNMAKYIIYDQHGPVVYDLIGVSNHYGGMGGGHYTAYCRNRDDSNWYHFDDTSVSPVSEDAVVSRAAYVLFYMRRDPHEAIGLSIHCPQNNAATSTCTQNNASAASGTPDADDSDMASGEEDHPMDTN